MKRFFVVLLTFAITLVMVGKSHAEPFGVSYQETLKNKYTAPGDLIVLVDKPVLQHDFMFSFGQGFFLDIWSCSTVDPWLNFVEVDGGGGYSRSWENMRLDIFLSFFNNRSLEVLGTGDVLYSKVQLTESITECDVIERIETYHLIGPGLNGELFSLALKKETPFKNLGSVSSTWGFTLDDGAFGLQSNLLFKMNLEFNCTATKDFSLSAGINVGLSVTDPENKENAGRDSVPIIYLTSTFN